jgi:hypothetical protein
MFVQPPVRTWAVWVVRVAILATPLGVASAQAPTGTIAGMVRDASSAAVAGAKIKAINRATGISRETTSSQIGDYSFPALLSGQYELSVEATGFQQMIRSVTVEAGTATTADFSLRVGDVRESVTVDGVSPQIQYETHTVGGLVTQGQIEN